MKISGNPGATVTVKALAVAGGYADSAIATFGCTIARQVRCIQVPSSQLARDRVQSPVGETVYAGTDGDGVWTEVLLRLLPRDLTGQLFISVTGDLFTPMDENEAPGGRKP